jgi:hypothetical protein
MSLLQQLLKLLSMAKKPTKPAPTPVPTPAPAPVPTKPAPAPLPIPDAPELVVKKGGEARLRLPAGYKQDALQVMQASRGGVYEPLLTGFGGSHTDPDGTVVVPGVGPNYPGDFRFRIGASATNQVGKELVILNPALAPTTPPTATPAPAPAPTTTPAPAPVVVLPVPDAPTLYAQKNLDARFQLPDGYHDITLTEIEIS